MTNFDFLLDIPSFSAFADVAVAAEKIYRIDPGSSVINCRRALEFAVKWMYSIDSALVMPFQDSLATLLTTEEFRDIVDYSLLQRLELIRRTGNIAAHSGKKISKEQAALCLENLFIFIDFLAYCYTPDYTGRKFDASLLTAKAIVKVIPKPKTDNIKLSELYAENAALKSELTALRKQQEQTYVPKPLELTEYKTRKIYIDTVLQELGWIQGQDWIDEVQLDGMPNAAGVGFADYVLYGSDSRPLAVIEAKRTCVDVSKGRQQAKLYADILERKYHRRPVVFLTNGFETRIIDNQYPERRCSTIYSKRDLEKLFNLHTMRTTLKNVMVDRNIAGRYYQEAAIKAVCEAFDRKNRRKALLVMATGSGKTRTIIELCDIFLQHGWVKNILFLADRNSLVTQAKRSFINLLPDLSVTNLVEEKDNYTAHCVFSTYQTMYNVIDSACDENGKLFTSGHFDLVICDEAHRSVYNKYKDIFNYFDAPLVGLTATPKDEIDKNTYEIFELEAGIPTYGYDLAQAVQDGFLVDFLSIETTLKFIQEGINYDDLSDEEKEEFEKTFADENGEIPENIASSALNSWLFNEDTIRRVLDILMTKGLKINYGEKMGKTVIFAKNHKHAEKILEVFNKEYPHLPNYAKVIDNYMTYAQNAIDEFSVPDKEPQIAISVDMLDTGIDIPEILNLVFFKKILSKSKFWQMIGRGTRLCKGLLDGHDKEKFYIFDFCGNFEFFRIGGKSKSSDSVALQEAIFNLKSQIIYKLQDISYQTQELKVFRENLVNELVDKVRQLNRDNFAVKQHIKYVDLYSNPDNYNSLTYEDTLTMAQEISPLVTPDNDDASAVRFDALLFSIELAYLAGKKHSKAYHDLFKKVNAIANVANIPEIMAQSDLINKILHSDYMENAGINEFEYIRENLRTLIKYIPVQNRIYYTNFTDDILTTEVHESEFDNSYLANYKAKVEYYIRQHQSEGVFAKLKSNIPLKASDMPELEKILWHELGTKEDYELQYQHKPIGELVREIVGLDMGAAKEAFAEYLSNVNLDSRQIYFVNQIIEYIVHNGLLKDLSVLQESPFSDRGSIVEIFTDLSVWMGIRKVIDRVNANAIAA
ncbi:MAG: DEAD/DEAH box helicase family protein [Spirochaetia bacterium]|nr:DEAD/DEAH box helicase family protein [Spirochaetia bacterium]